MIEKMKKTMTFAMILVVALAFASCGKYKGFKKDNSGYYYKAHEVNTDAPQPQDGDLALINFTMRTADSTFNGGITYLPIDPSFGFYEGDLYTALKSMHEKDSMTFIFEADSFAKYYLNGRFPFQEKEIYMDVRLMEIMTKAEIEEYEAEFQREMEDRQNSEESMRNSYLETNNIKVKPNESGLYYIQTQAGKGKKATEGKIVSVHYTGKLLDGTVFDSSHSRGQPIDFILGSRQVIPGWDEGIAMMREGGKATLIVPSELGYGSRDAGMIPPYSTLVFDVELVSVADME